jgi:hypothetical protein
MEERNKQPRSRRWQYAIIGACIGGLVVGFLALAFRGPTVISINNGCCCQQQWCVVPGEKVGNVGKKTPTLPTPGEALADSASGSCCQPGITERYFPFAPFVSGAPGGSGGGRSSQPDDLPAGKIPEPSVLALVLIGAIGLLGRVV